MNADSIKRSGTDLLTAVQFLTRIPTPQLSWDAGSLARAAKFFPLVGVLVGGAGALLHAATVRHLPRPACALLVVVLLVMITGGLHEDGLADAADGFGGGHTPDRILLILRDSRIGTYGAAALCLALVGRVILLSALPAERVAHYLIAAAVLCRWTILPLSYFLPPARDEDGQGARVAKLTTRASLVFGTVTAFALAGLLLHRQAVAPIVAAVAIAWLSGLFYMRKISGVTGDCFGATAQVTEVAIYLCGAWAL